MKQTLAALAAAMLLLACGGAGGKKAHEQQNVMAIPAEPSPETFALGTEVAAEGFVPQRATGESFSRGGELYLSVHVAGASTDQQIQVEWRDAAGRVLRRDTQHAGEGVRYVAFSSGLTTTWSSGPHRAVITINGRTVSEKTFALL